MVLRKPRCASPTGFFLSSTRVVGCRWIGRVKILSVCEYYYSIKGFVWEISFKMQIFLELDVPRFCQLNRLNNKIVFKDVKK